MLAPRSFETDPFDPHRSICSIKQLLYIYRRIYPLFLPCGKHKFEDMTIGMCSCRNPQIKVTIFFVGYMLVRVDTTFAQSLNGSKQI